jgi:acyl-CoA thioester hydrolase
MSEPVLTYRGTVYPWQCDHVGHMNVMWYVGKFDEATWQLFAAIGLTRSFLNETNSGMAALEQHITYKRELLPGDQVTIHTSVLEVKDKTIRFVHEMRNDETGDVAATTTLTGVHLDRTTRKSSPWPAEARERAETMIVRPSP